MHLGLDFNGNFHSASDSDESFHYSTNRGNKLKRKAKYVHEGQLDRPNGPKVYKRVSLAGNTRRTGIASSTEIVSRRLSMPVMKGTS